MSALVSTEELSRILATELLAPLRESAAGLASDDEAERKAAARAVVAKGRELGGIALMSLAIRVDLYIEPAERAEQLKAFVIGAESSP